MRLIDADAFKEWLMKNSISEREEEESRQIGIWIDSFPSAEPERKKCEWIYSSPNGFKCSECGGYLEIGFGTVKMNFCPNCGSYNGSEQE